MFFRRKRPPEGAVDPVAPAPDDSVPEGPSTQFLTGQASVDRRSVKVLLDAIARVSQSRDLESLLADLVDASIETTGAERGLLVLGGQDELTVRMARQRGGKPATGDMRFSTTVVKRVISKGEPVRATVTSDSEAMELGTSVFDLKLRAVMCVPLLARTEALGSPGALYVDSKAATREFKNEDLALFAALAQHLTIALENARLHLESLEKVKLERSLEIASQIQAGLMPQMPEGIPGYDVFGWYRPAERTTGDFYDFVHTRAGRFGIVVGDVTGHGVGPALIMATAQASLRSYLRVLEDPASVVTMVNQDIGPRMDDGLFLTLFTAIFSPDGMVQSINAGHTPPLVWRAGTRTIETIRGNGPALGMMDDFQYAEGPRISLAPGDMLVAYTDGFVEARSARDPNVLFDESGVRAVLERCAAEDSSAQVLTEALVATALDFAGGVREDDMTVVAVKRTG